MKKKALHKELFRTIKRTWNRYLAIILIVLLGVAFFSGIRATKPDMQLSADAFYDASNFYDIRVLGTFGLTDEDVTQIGTIDGVESVEPAYSVDVLCKTQEKRLVIKMMSLTKDINQLELLEGRLPQKTGECLADTKFMESTGLHVGDTVTVESGTEDDISDSLQDAAYTIVGTGKTTIYLSLERGSSAIGSGEINSFLVVCPEEFTLEAYTEIYVTTTQTDDKNTYGDSYQDRIDTIVSDVEGLEEEQCKKRYEEVKKEIEDKIADGEAEVKDGEKKIADAEQKIADGEAELADAKQKIEDAEEELQTQSDKLSDAKQQIADGETKLADAKPKLTDARAELDKAKKEIDTKQQELYEGYNQYKNGLDTYEDGKKKLDETRETLKEQIEQYEQTKAMLPPDMQLAYEKQFEDTANEIEQNDTKLEEGKEELDSAYYQICVGELKLTDARKELKNGESEYEQSLKEYEEGKIELEENKQKVIDGEQKLTQAKKDLEQAKVDYAEGEEEFKQKKKEAEEELEPAKIDLQKGKDKIADAKEQLKDMEMPEWYVLDRNANVTYVEYGQDAERIGAIGEVFPVIFFLVAALVALTTMTRMVEEERTQIGTLKALGYTNREIAGKYIFYAVSASLIGSLIGLVLGQKLLPYVIITAYKILYNNLPMVLTPLSPLYSIAATLAAVLCTTVAAFFACANELREQPSVLMRPASPKNGKRVFLEYVPFIWKHLNFSVKSTIRNLFRYKKRFFMTIFGIGGCMSLLIVGFGLKDSINVVGTVQFKDIITYSAAITLEDDITNEQRAQLMDVLQNDNRIQKHLSAYQHLMEAEQNGVKKEVYLVVPEKEEEMNHYVSLRNRLTKEELSLPDDGVVVSEKLAKLLDVKVGDTIILKEDDVTQKSITISAITENYFQNYVYMSNAYYKEIFEENPEYNTVFLHDKFVDEQTESAMGTDLLLVKGVSQISFYSSLSAKISDMLKSMDAIILVLILSAGALAFIVLYNLNNINVTERKRELSTLKVLGFYDGEVSAYVFRENIVLTVFGCLFGLLMGTVLTRFVIVTAEVDIMMFGREIKMASYLYSVLLTFAFSTIVNGVMHFSLKRIDMLEALKSVE